MIFNRFTQVGRFWLVLVSIMSVQSPEAASESGLIFDRQSQSVNDGPVKHFVSEVVTLALSMHYPHGVIVVDIGCELDAMLRTSFPVSFIDMKPLQTVNPLRMNRDYEAVASYRKTIVFNATYLAFSCSSSLGIRHIIDKRIHRIHCLALLRRLSPPFSSLVFYTFWDDVSSLQKNAISHGYNVQRPPFLDIAVTYGNHDTSAPNRKLALWAAHCPEELRYSHFLGQFISASAERPCKLSMEVSIGSLHCKAELDVRSITIVEQKATFGYRLIYRTNTTLRARHGLSNTTRISVVFRSKLGTDPVVSTIWPVSEFPFVAFAKVPHINSPSQVAQALFNPTMWLLLFGLAILVCLCLRVFELRTQMTFDILFLLIVSVWSGAELPRQVGDDNLLKYRFILLAGLWTLSSQVTSVYLQASVVAGLQALPDQRIKEVHCSSSNQKINSTITMGRYASAVEPAFVTNDLPFFFNGDALCQRRQRIDRLYERLLGQFRTYEIPLDAPTYETTVIQPVVMEFHENHVKQTHFPEWNFDAFGRFGLKISQVELSLGLRHTENRLPYSQLRTFLRLYLKRPLHPNYRIRNTCSKNDKHINKQGKKSSFRCIAQHELEESKVPHSMILDDLMFPLELSACGSVLALGLLLGEFLYIALKLW